jgi:hypothetical protein
MEIILGFIVLLTLSLLVTRKTGDLFNPINAVAAGFFFPMLIAHLKILPLQPDQWSSDTISIYLQSWLIWLVLPAAVLLIVKSPVKSNPNYFLARGKFKWKYLGRTSAIIIGACYLMENWLLSGFIFPLFVPEIDIHTAYTSGLGIITSSFTGGVVLVLTVYYIRNHEYIDLLLIVAILALPFTRLARLDSVLYLIPVIVLSFYLKNFSSRKIILAILIVVLLLPPFLIAISQYRADQWAVSSVDLNRDLGFVGDSPILKVTGAYYRYIVLSFDSFDGLVRRNSDNFRRTWGLYTFRPITLGIFRLHNIFEDYPTSENLAERSSPILRARVIATGLSYFFLDFGVELISIPLILYISIALLLYHNQWNHLGIRIAYCLIFSALLMTGFTDFLSNVKLLYALLFALVILKINFGSLRFRPPVRVQPRT